MRRAAIVAVAVLLWAPAAAAQSARPTAVHDARSGHKLQLSIGAGAAVLPQRARFGTAELRVEGEALPGWIVGGALPLFGYTGIRGNESFVRGNVGLETAWQAESAAGLQLRIGAELNLPTFEQPRRDPLFPDDPRQALLTCRLDRPGLVLPGQWSAGADLQLGYRHARFSIVARAGGLLAWEAVDVNRDRRTNTTALVLTGAEAQVVVWGPIAVKAGWIALFDPDRAGAGVRLVTGAERPQNRAQQLVTAAVGAEWAGWGVDAGVSVPVGGDVARLLSPVGTLRVWLRIPRSRL